MRLRGRVVGVAAAAVLSWAAPAAGQGFPAFISPVVDEAGLVPDDVEQQVNAALNDYRMRTSNQIAVAVVRTTGGRPIEEYSLELANTWGVGLAGADNGVLVVIASDDRRVRIEVGRGLESVLTDQAAAGIVNDGLVSRLRTGDIGGGVTFATESVRRILGDPLLGTTPASSPVPVAGPPVVAPPVPGFAPVEVPGGPGGAGGGVPGWIFFGFIVAAVLTVIGRLGGGGSVGHGGRAADHAVRHHWWHTNPHHGSGHVSGGNSPGGGAGGGGGQGGGQGGGGSFGGGGASGSW